MYFLGKVKDQLLNHKITSIVATVPAKTPASGKKPGKYA
jgi:hypothetical protein